MGGKIEERMIDVWNYYGRRWMGWNGRGVSLYIQSS